MIVGSGGPWVGGLVGQWSVDLIKLSGSMHLLEGRKSRKAISIHEKELRRTISHCAAVR